MAELITQPLLHSSTSSRKRTRDGYLSTSCKMAAATATSSLEVMETTSILPPTITQPRRPIHSTKLNGFSKTLPNGCANGGIVQEHAPVS